jgi:Predicted transcriptional regulator, consists of a Zn-ribbon and ATP-cone domains
MKCPYCGSLEDKVIDSRTLANGEAIRRRRECLACGLRFTSYERIEEKPLMVVKRDGRREPFERQKSSGAWCGHSKKGRFLKCQSKISSMRSKMKQQSKQRHRTKSRAKIWAEWFCANYMRSTRLPTSVLHQCIENMNTLNEFIHEIERLEKGQTE